MKKKEGIGRRDFFKTTAFGLAGLGTLPLLSQEKAAEEKKIDIPKIKRFRTLGRTGFRVSDIGIGTSRNAIVPLMNAVLDAGVNYIDTAEGYLKGAAETSIGEAIKGRDRKNIFITTKIQTRDIISKEQVIGKVQQCLQRLQTDYVDCLMGQGAPSVEAIKDPNFHAAAEQLKKEGKVRFLGVASHGARQPGQGDPMEKVLLAAVEDGRFDLVLLVYNFVQKEAGEQVLEAAAKKNIATTVMKSDPLGRYYETRDRLEQMKASGQTPDENMQRYLAQMEESVKKAEPFLQQNNLRTPAEIKAAALKFVLADSRAQVLTLAFNNFADVPNFLKLSGSGLDAKDKQLLAGWQESCSQFYCRHACGQCESACPRQVPVNQIMRYFHYFDAHGSERFAMEKYSQLNGARAGLCRDCAGFCSGACPYSVPIQGLLQVAHAKLSLS